MGSGSKTVHFELDMVISSNKQEFLTNKDNKIKFIDLFANRLQVAGCSVKHATEDADLLITQTAVESASEKTTALISEDTDLLILLYYHADLDAHDLFFMPEPKKTSISRKIWNIKKTKCILGTNACTNILFLHAITGCDTASRQYGIGKAVALVKSKNGKETKSYSSRYELRVLRQVDRGSALVMTALRSKLSKGLFPRPYSEERSIWG
ncbi:uncharacterized protein LOC116298445 [Actinia tenebrosa]|uniref:Uncharacterized protein LOC116298445 n=1 Tax=Actinia tenebrosa TaxID=6105 RepID=A0A6P8I4G4_ACTTE|nr:uncharacterized protein LOC116298445 [Actinia tenebrosa]